MGAPVSEPRPYQRVYADLLARIERGDLSVGSRLPSQPALAAEYGVALLTVRHAIELLRRGGYLSVEHGRGTFVTDRARSRPGGPRPIRPASSTCWSSTTTPTSVPC